MDRDLIRRGLCSIGSAILGFGSVASIDTATAAEPAVPVPEVTVIAPRPPTPEELAGEAVPNFIASHARPSTVIHQITRWHIGICPAAYGLSPAFNDFVTARLLAVAATVGAPRDPATKCSHNVEIFFTTEPQKVLDDVVKRNTELLGFHYPHQTKALATVRRAIQGWYVTGTGDTGGWVIDAALPYSLKDPNNLMTAGTVPPARLGTRLYTGINSSIFNALIVVDANQVTGHTIGSISDFLAMMILSRVQSPDTCGALPSILDLMAENCGREEPAQLTAGDIAFLRALYRMDLKEQLSLETYDIQNAMMREFKSH